VRYHLGYPNTEPVSSMVAGIPSSQQSLYLVELAMDRIIPSAVSLVQELIAVMDAIESQQVDSMKRLKAQQLGDMKLRSNNTEATEGDLLEGEYMRWCGKLAMTLGAPMNPYSPRHGGAGHSMNVRVLNGV